MRIAKIDLGYIIVNDANQTLCEQPEEGGEPVIWTDRKGAEYMLENVRALGAMPTYRWASIVHAFAE